MFAYSWTGRTFLRDGQGYITDALHTSSTYQPELVPHVPVFVRRCKRPLTQSVGCRLTGSVSLSVAMELTLTPVHWRTARARLTLGTRFYFPLATWQ